MSRRRADGHAIPAGVLGRNLWRHRVAAGLTIAELGERSGVDTGNLSRLERGRHVYPTIDTCVRIARVLGITLDQLVASESDASSSPARRSPHAAPPSAGEGDTPAAETSAAAAPAAARPTGTSKCPNAQNPRQTPRKRPGALTRREERYMLTSRISLSADSDAQPTIDAWREAGEERLVVEVRQSDTQVLTIWGHPDAVLDVLSGLLAAAHKAIGRGFVTGPAEAVRS